jgi:hypothetical protein
MSSKLFEVKMPKSGEVLALRALPFKVSTEIDRKLAKPTPPTVKIERPNGDFVDEPNRQDPDYLQALRDRNAELNQKILDFAFAYCVATPMDDEKKAAVDELIPFLKQFDLYEEGESHHQLWVTHIAVASPEDIAAFTNAVVEGGAPTDPKSASGPAASMSDTKASP